VDTLSLLTAVAPVFLMVVMGYAIRRAGWLSAEADASLLRMVVNLLYPCLILDTLLGNAAFADRGNLLLAPVVGFASVALGYAASYFAAPIFGITEPIPRRTFAFTTGIYNYGYIALPVVQKLYGEQATAVLFIHNIGVETALWTLGVMLLTRTSPRDGWRKIFSVPLVAIAATILLNFAGAHEWLPAFVLSAAKSLGGAAIPLGLILTGAVFADQMQENTTPGRGQVSLGSCTLRLGLLPLFMIALARWLPCPSELRHVILVQAAMPAAVVPVILAKHYGGDASVALRIVLATSVLGLVTVPLWLWIGMLVAGP
jgi:predicted permease